MKIGRLGTYQASKMCVGMGVRRVSISAVFESLVRGRRSVDRFTNEPVDRVSDYVEDNK